MSNYELKGERNYSARVIRVRQLVELPGLDNLRGVPLDGYMALVSKDTPLDSLMVMFPAETQLDPEFTGAFNLYRKPDKNIDPAQTGYLEDSARIRAIKLRGHVSSALLLPVWYADMTEGMEFDTIAGKTICWKYVPPVKGNPRTPAAVTKAWKRVDAKFLPEHVDTGQWGREHHTIPDDAHVVISQKLHGTSLRVANTVVKRQLKWYERLLVKWGVPVSDHSYDAVYGSRKVIKDANNPNQNHFYDTDLWSTEGAKLAPLLPPNVVLYGELIGWVPGTSKPIQTGYTYNVPKGEAHFYAYRVSIVTEHAAQYDLSDAAAREFCASRGIRFVPKLAEMWKDQLTPTEWLDQKYAKDHHANTSFGGFGFLENPVPLAKESPCDEGVVVRVEGLVPKFLKIKSPLFLAHETKQLDKGEADLETEGSVDTETDPA